MRHAYQIRCALPLTLLAAAAWLLLGCAGTEAPYTGRDRILLVAPSALEQQSEDFWSAIQKTAPNLSNTLAQRTLDCIVQRLSETDFRLSALNIRANVLDNDTVNALALPNGRIGIYSGLMKKMPSADALAFVVAHELAHILNQHGAEKVSHWYIAQLGNIVAAAAIDKLVPEDASAKQLASIALEVGFPLAFLLPNSRTLESEADAVGLIMASRAGFDIDAAVDAINALKSTRLPAWLSTHPAKADRLTALRTLIRTLQQRLPPGAGAAAPASCDLAPYDAVRTALGAGSKSLPGAQVDRRPSAVFAPGTYKFFSRWGDTILKVSRTGSVAGSYAHQNGRIAGTLQHGIIVARWFQDPSRDTPSSGIVEFRLRSGGWIDGRWRYDSDQGWHEDWDGRFD